jgi:hypothetical protein
MASILEHHRTKNTDPCAVRLRLANRPVERDTELISAGCVWIGDTQVAVERWAWDGIRGSSAVILTESVRDLDNEGLLALLREGGIRTGDRVTIERDATFPFVSFDFAAQ